MAPPPAEPAVYPGFRALWKFDLGLIAALAVLYNEVIFGEARVIGRDVLHYLVPIGAALQAGLVGAGSLLWDSGVDHGLPVIARWSPMVFYPGQWLHALFAPLTAISIGILLHLLLAAMATMRLALRYTPSIPAAWVGAFSFAYGGYLISVSVGGGYLFGASLLPLSLLCFHRLAERPTLSRMGQTAAVMALQVFCADPQTLLYEGVFLAPLIVLFHHRTTSTLQRRLGAAALATAFAMALSACQWVPSLEFSTLSVRAQGVAAEDSAAWALHPLRIAQFLSPHIFGAVTPRNTFWARSLVNARVSIPWAPFLYNGLLVWAGIAAIDGRRGARRLALLGVLTLFFLVVAFGPWTPLHHLVTSALLGARLFRYPEKLVLFVALGTCLLGATGLGRLLEDLASSSSRRWCRRHWVAGACALLAAIAASLRLWLDPSSQTRLEWFSGVLARQQSGLRPDLALEMTASSLVHTAAMGSMIAASLLFAHRLRPGLLVLLGACLVSADLLPASLTQRYLVADGSSYSGIPAACEGLRSAAGGPLPLVWWKFAPDPSAERADKSPVAKPALIYPEPRNQELEGTRFERQRKLEWQTLRPNIGAPYCVRYAEGYEAGRLTSHRLLTTSMRDDLERLLRILGVEYIIAAPGAVDPSLFRVEVTSKDLRTVIHRVADPLPYAHSTGRAVAVTSLEGAVALLADKAFDITASIVLERATAPMEYPAAPRLAQVRLHREGEIVVEVDFAAAGYLVLEETYYPGWRAELEKGATRVERANANFIGMELPAGNQKVRLVFDPPLQRRGNAASLGSLAVMLALISGAQLRRRPASGS